ncbi:MAG: 4-hydroxy-tetrahydrodipicolinate synthase [Deltaproteobacteria bacterium]|nr:MAG: 4-hydroxy-tetrahydrodipicolinate synthase [Deltaproteobacteria bacterium]
MKPGCYTALITPFKEGGIDYEGLDRLTAFQMENGISGILAVGTTGESPTLSWDEHKNVITAVAKNSDDKCICIAGTGSNNTKETLAGTAHAADVGAGAVLLVDPYYNGPSSLEIRREYVAPVAAAFPELTIIPYIIPGRTGAQLLPEDLALLAREFGNINTVKEATGNLENMKKTRKCCGDDYLILSGDDGLTSQMMTDPEISAGGVISVITNIVPRAVADMVRLFNQGKPAEASKLESALAPLFNLVTVNTMEKTPWGEVVCRARNPLAVKTLMQILGLPSGPCRKPVGRMTRAGLDKVLDIARTVQAENPEIFKPLADFFNVDIDRRLNDPVFQKGLCYESY